MVGQVTVMLDEAIDRFFEIESQFVGFANKIGK